MQDIHSAEWILSLLDERRDGAEATTGTPRSSVGKLRSNTVSGAILERELGWSKFKDLT